jgi:hypothetical protein
MDQQVAGVDVGRVVAADVVGGCLARAHVNALSGDNVRGYNAGSKDVE